jgi:hypothetical protein
MGSATGRVPSLYLFRTIRVALDTYEGTAVATTEADRRVEVAGLATPPAGMSDTPSSGTYSQTWFETNYGIEVSPPGTAINDGNRLQYSTDTSAYGLTPYDGMGDDRRVFVVVVCKAAYDEGLKLEDLQAIARHECNHAVQHIAVTQTGTVWRRLDDYYASANGYQSFRESESYLISLLSNASWRYISSRLPLFHSYYNSAVAACSLITDPSTKADAKKLLQDIYDDIPFLEMKRSDYDYYVRPPE